MNVQDQVAKLQRLLERVRGRAGRHSDVATVAASSFEPTTLPLIREARQPVVEEVAEVPFEDVVEEEISPPPSSRRKMQERALDDLAFGEDARPPVHTPPPESGRLPAAPQSFDLGYSGVHPALERDAILSASPEVRFDHIGEAQRFSPATFGELLEATLKL